jgi:hypothetical protein
LNKDGAKNLIYGAILNKSGAKTRKVVYRIYTKNDIII